MDAISQLFGLFNQVTGHVCAHVCAVPRAVHLLAAIGTPVVIFQPFTNAGFAKEVDVVE